MSKKNTEKRGYGLKPPPMSFSFAIDTLDDIYLKTGGSLSKEDLADIMGSTTKSSHFNRKIQLLKKLGLITYRINQVDITQLAKKIVRPSSSSDRPEGLVASMLNIEILNTIFEKYNGGLIPQLDFLSNWVTDNTEVPNNLKTKWAEYFLDAARTANLLQDRAGGSIYLRGQPQVPKEDLIIASDNISADDYGSPISQVIQSAKDSPSAPIPNLEQFCSGMAGGSMKSYQLSNDNKAYFYVPEGLSPADVKRLRAAIKSLEIELEALMIPNNNTTIELMNNDDIDET